MKGITVPRGPRRPGRPTPHEQLLIGEAADRLGLPAHTLRRACDAGVLDVPRAGPVRVFPVGELETYRRQLAAGYLGRVTRPARPAHPVR